MKIRKNPSILHGRLTDLKLYDKYDDELERLIRALKVFIYVIRKEFGLDKFVKGFFKKRKLIKLNSVVLIINYKSN